EAEEGWLVRGRAVLYEDLDVVHRLADPLRETLHRIGRKVHEPLFTARHDPSIPTQPGSETTMAPGGRDDQSTTGWGFQTLLRSPSDRRAAASRRTGPRRPCRFARASVRGYR